MTRERTWLITSVLLAAAAGGLELLFSRFGGGLITPEGSVSTEVALLGAAMLTMRLVAVVGVPVVLAVLAGSRCLEFLRNKNPQ